MFLFSDFWVYGWLGEGRGIKDRDVGQTVIQAAHQRGQRIVLGGRSGRLNYGEQ